MPAISLKKKIRPVTQSIKKPEPERLPERLFLAVVPGSNLSLLLETIYTAHLLKKKNRGFRCEAIVSYDSQALLKSTGIFDTIHVAEQDTNLKNTLNKFKPYILYIPDPNLKMKLAALFVPGKFRIGGERLRLLSWLSNHFRNGDYDDLLKLKSKGIDLVPESSQINIEFEEDAGFISRYGNLPGEFIWLSLFDEHDLTSSWPIGHASRLIRLLDRSGWKTIIPIPENAPVKLLLQLKESAPGAFLLDNPGPDHRAMGIARTSLVVGPAGAETLLATFLGKKIIELHDMKSRRILNEDSFRNKDDFIKKRSVSFYTRTANSLKRNIMPPMQTCNEDCSTCLHNSCMEFISPERVFEAVKRVFLPL
jgi:ADP-heptose:LPS heptosyltransferase